MSYSLDLFLVKVISNQLQAIVISCSQTLAKKIDLFLTDSCQYTSNGTTLQQLRLTIGINFLDHELIPYCYSFCSCWRSLFKKSQDSLASNWIEMKFGMIVLQVNLHMHQFTKSDFRQDAILSKYAHAYIMHVLLANKICRMYAHIWLYSIYNKCQLLTVSASPWPAG